MNDLKHRIPEDVFDKLIKATIDSLGTILSCHETELQQLTCLSAEDVNEVVYHSANIIFKEIKFSPAAYVPKWKRISTGCACIDSITRGGIPTNCLTEIVGSSGTGKTQLALQLSLMVQTEEHENKGVVYICTEDVFASRRLIQLADTWRRKYQTQYKFEDNIFVDHIADFEQLRRCICVRLPQLLRVRQIGLIVIDSIAGLFRGENEDVSYANRSQDFMTIVGKFNELIDSADIAILCLNQVSENIDTGMTEPCLGLAWSNLVTCRFAIVRKEGSLVRNFKVIFAPDLANQSCSFIVNENGVVAYI